MPGGDKNIKPEDGKQFSSSYQPANRGRKPLIFSTILKEWIAEGYEEASAESVKRIYEMLLSMPLIRIKEIAGRPDDDKNEYPVLLRIAARDITGKRGSEIIEAMLSRAQGKPKQQQEITGKDGKDLFPQDAFSPSSITVRVISNKDDEAEK